MEDKIFDIITDLLREDITKAEAIEKLLVLYNVVGWIEQLPCACGVQLKETTIQVFCPKCYKTWKIK